MRIKHLFVSNYKNLKEFSLDFDGDSFIDVFVGKNGSGKSNMFEALIEIFRHLYEDKYDQIKFDYRLIYTIGPEEIMIYWKWVEEKWLDETGKETKKVTQDKLPNNILIYYSGHNPKVTELVHQYEENFRKGLKGAVANDSRKFIGIGNEYKALLLTSLLLQPDGSKAKQYIVEKLGIKSINPEFKIVLKRPQYARNKPKDYEIDPYLADTHYWRAEGIVKEFIDKLLPAIHLDPSGSRKEGYFKDDDQYVHYIDIKRFNDIFKDKTVQANFRNFDNIKSLEMLESIGVDVTLNDGSVVNIENFSDGQFQSVYIYSIIELFNDRTCITLLDEPDSFLHPEWQYKFLTQIIDIASHSSECNHVLMTSHSASTIAASRKTHLNLFALNGSSITITKIGKSDIIRELSNGVISLSNDESIMSINTFLKNTDQPVLFTEGISDEYILDTAWKKLYPGEKRRFCIHNAFDRIFLRNLLSREDIRKNFPDRVVFALFDFDEAYDDWNGLKGEDIISDPFIGLTRKLKDCSNFCMLLPVPKNETIKKQVLNSENKPWGKGSESHLSIELLFYNGVEEDPNFSIHDISGGGKLVEFSGNKVQFAETIVPKLGKERFEIFRPMFEFIKSKI